MTRTRQFPGGQSHVWEQESGRGGEISNMFDFFADPPRQARKIQLTLTDYVYISPTLEKSLATDSRLQWNIPIRKSKVKLCRQKILTALHIRENCGTHAHMHSHMRGISKLPPSEPVEEIIAYLKRLQTTLLKLTCICFRLCYTLAIFVHFIISIMSMMTGIGISHRKWLCYVNLPYDRALIFAEFLCFNFTKMQFATSLV